MYIRMCENNKKKKEKKKKPVRMSDSHSVCVCMHMNEKINSHFILTDDTIPFPSCLVSSRHVSILTMSSYKNHIQFQRQSTQISELS